jgi:histidyl-tRNA synthetase
MRTDTSSTGWSTWAGEASRQVEQAERVGQAGGQVSNTGSREAFLTTKPPGGTRDFLADEIRRREYVVGVIQDVYERYGFEPLETPAFENIETLLGKYGEEGNKLIFKILKRGEHEQSGEADLALRYDLTVPLARVVAQYQNGLPKFFKRYQIQPVWRADRPARGRFREFYQCDIDAIGSTSPVVDVEVVASVCDVLIRLGFQDFAVRMNHRRALTALLDCAGVPGERHADALVALDKLDKIGIAGVEQELSRRGVELAATKKCLDFFRSITGDDASGQSALTRLRDFVARHPDGTRAVDELAEIVQLAETTPAGTRIRIDPSLARGLSYYTGAIMEIEVPDLAASLGAGGRYDNLIGMFLGRDVPATGFSLGLERVIVVMTERGMFPPAVAGSVVDVMVSLWDDRSRAEALALAAELRRQGLCVDVYPEADRLGKQFKYAASRHLPFVAVVGEDERARGEVAVKDLRTGEQTAVARADAARFIASRLKSTHTTNG